MEILENMSVGTAVPSRPTRRPGRWVRLPIEPHARRVEILRRAYSRALGHKATTIERAAIFKAALLTAKAEVAALDPCTSVAELTKLVNIADRAVRRLPFLDGPSRRPTPTMREVLEGEGESEADEATEVAGEAV